MTKMAWHMKAFQMKKVKQSSDLIKDYLLI